MSFAWEPEIGKAALAWLEAFLKIERHDCLSRLAASE
jgi:hypothetical protein